MKKLLVLMLFLMSVSFLYPNEVNNTDPIMLNDEVFSFEIKPAITSEFVKIETNRPSQSLHVKIIDKAGFIRIDKKLHLDRELDVSELRKGYYLIKIYSENSMAIKRFYKGQDAVNYK